MTTWRYIAQRARTGEFLNWDLPLDRDELTWQLNGAGALRATASPDVGNLRAPDGELVLDEWGTFIYAEADGILRWGGIVVASDFDGPDWSVEATSFAGYPFGLPYLGDYVQTSVDPLNVVREVWRHIQQDYIHGDLGLVVPSTTSPLRLGTTDEPYSLGWWEAKDCGSEISTLSRETPFDFTEEHTWEDDGSIDHRLRLGYPRLGTKRRDLAFVQGENITQVVQVSRDGDRYANEVVGIGAGEGRSTLRRTTARSDFRLRRSVVWSDKGVTRAASLNSSIRDELQRRAGLMEFESIEVRQHPHARLGSWSLGDDILVRADLPWLGDIALWHRVVAWSLIEEDRAELTLVRSDRFDYTGG